MQGADGRDTASASQLPQLPLHDDGSHEDGTRGEFGSVFRRALGGDLGGLRCKSKSPEATLQPFQVVSRYPDWPRSQRSAWVVVGDYGDPSLRGQNL